MFPSPLVLNQFLIPNQFKKDGGAVGFESLEHDETRIGQFNKFALSRKPFWI